MEIKNQKNGKTAFGLVRDSCPGCGDGDIGRIACDTISATKTHTWLLALDMSPSLFQALGATLDDGVVKVDWHFKPKGFHP